MLTTSGSVQGLEFTDVGQHARQSARSATPLTRDNERSHEVSVASRRRNFTRSGFYAPSWTQTGVPIGIRLLSQTQSIAGTLTRTHPCEAG